MDQPNPYLDPPPPARTDPVRAPSLAASRPTSPGAFRLFRVLNTDVFLHWSWFIAAYFLIQARGDRYSSMAWNAVEYLAGFVLVLLHEFGHVLATRQVGGRADKVVLWPLGGLAFATPPARPWATLWSVAAGPLVNVALAPILIGLAIGGAWMPEGALPPDLGRLFVAVAIFNIVMLVFNLLPIYPLDGGQIFQALLWRMIGRARALMVAAWVGMAGALALAGLALYGGEWWMALMMGYLFLGAYRGIAQARILGRLASLERRQGPPCPSCGANPPKGPFWLCLRCRTPVDRYEPATACIDGHDHAVLAACPDCRWLPVPEPAGTKPAQAPRDADPLADF
ncbi:MAG: site-2 protease family protein [Isosphaeraceae bacterium]